MTPRPSSPVPAAPATEAAAHAATIRKSLDQLRGILRLFVLPADDALNALVSLVATTEQENERLHRLHLDRTKRTHADLTELISRAEAAEQQRDEAREALTLPQFVASKMFKRAEAAERRAAEAERVLLRIAEPLYDDVLRARLLRQGLSTDEMEQFVEVVELNQKLARAAVSAGGPERTTT